MRGLWVRLPPLAFNACLPPRAATDRAGEIGLTCPRVKGIASFWPPPRAWNAAAQAVLGGIPAIMNASERFEAA